MRNHAFRKAPQAQARPSGPPRVLQQKRKFSCLDTSSQTHGGRWALGYTLAMALPFGWDLRKAVSNEAIE